ncbi:hypothetical protein ACFPJ4_11705 [Lysinimonas soli]|uniref:PH domain-containing protein n=1 Tax=Lysinimonas soli TaxID=1074233 RepID=A0ABW0NUH9_9MICO
MASTADPAPVVLVRPRRSLMVTAFVSIVLAMLPVFGVLYWFGVQHDTWFAVFVVHLALSIACLATLARQLTVYSAVTATELIGRGIFSPMLRVPLESIATVTIVPTYVGQSPDAVPQLLVRDREGHRLFRMRGTFWHPGDLTAIANALPVRATVVTEPLSIREFFRSYPGSAYWFENRPIMWVAVLAAAALLAFATTTWVMVIVGMPVAFLPS